MVVVEGPAKTVYIGGQDSVNASGSVVGKGDVAAQAEQVLRNLRAALAAGGAKPEHVVKWNVFVVEWEPLQAAFSAFRRAWVDPPNPPAITVAFVAGLANPDFLVEMDAIAVVPQRAKWGFRSTRRRGRAGFPPARPSPKPADAEVRLGLREYRRGRRV